MEAVMARRARRLFCAGSGGFAASTRRLRCRLYKNRLCPRAIGADSPTAPVFGTPSARTLRRPKRLALAKPPNPSAGAPKKSSPATKHPPVPLPEAVFCLTL